MASCGEVIARHSILGQGTCLPQPGTGPGSRELAGAEPAGSTKPKGSTEPAKAQSQQRGAREAERPAGSREPPGEAESPPGKQRAPRGSREPPGEAESPPGKQRAPGRLPKRATRPGNCAAPSGASHAATKHCAPRAGGVTRHGDRLDKAGQPGGPVSAVYSPAAACAARSPAPPGASAFP